ncbi:MAG: hypothetical protein LBD23_08780, partial [Oscillospiraceae bacterium]|nr:hypothetical protein [Oscillospiraceae bacterium]
MKKLLMIIIATMLCFGLVFISCDDNGSICEVCNEDPCSCENNGTICETCKEDPCSCEEGEPLVLFENGKWLEELGEVELVKSESHLAGSLTLVGNNLVMIQNTNYNIIFENTIDISAYTRFVVEINHKAWSDFWWLSGGLLIENDEDEDGYVSYRLGDEGNHGSWQNFFSGGVTTLTIADYFTTDHEVPFDPKLFTGINIGGPASMTAASILIQKIYLIGGAPPVDTTCDDCYHDDCDGSCDFVFSIKFDEDMYIFPVRFGNVTFAVGESYRLDMTFISNKPLPQLGLQLIDWTEGVEWWGELSDGHYPTDVGPASTNITHIFTIVLNPS